MLIKRISVVLAALVLIALGAWSIRAYGQAASAQAAPRKQATLPPLPFGPRDPLPRPPEMVAAVFQFAAEHPEVLRYVPCFCGCEHLGHHANDECFVKRRNANGDVVAWEPHGTECAVCLDVGRDAMQLYSSGASVRDIRDAIERKYAGAFNNHTPTPQPPKN